MIVEHTEVLITLSLMSKLLQRFNYPDSIYYIDKEQRVKMLLRN